MILPKITEYLIKLELRNIAVGPIEIIYSLKDRVLLHFITQVGKVTIVRTIQLRLTEHKADGKFPPPLPTIIFVRL
jgi:hypothetical protein